MGAGPRGVGLTCFYHARQSVAEAGGLGGKYFHVVVHPAEQVGHQDGVNVGAHEGLQGWAGNWGESAFQSHGTGQKWAHSCRDSAYSAGFQPPRITPQGWGLGPNLTPSALRCVS